MERLLSVLVDFEAIQFVGSGTAALEAFRKEQYDIAFLDHDLGRTKETGYTVACWLERNPQFKPETIVIHSVNPVGAKRMKQALPTAILAPFMWMNEEAMFRTIWRGITEAAKRA